MVATFSPSGALTLQFLAWIADGPRTYREAMEAWRSTCPRLSIWEDALADGLIARQNGGSMEAASVMLTARGRALLAADAALRRDSSASADVTP